MELGLRIALAGGLRISDHHSEALAELSIAETLASEGGRLLELARIHHLRGNIYYPLGKAENCFIEHKAALRFAKKAASTEWEARALGGLGDAYFLAGRITQAHRQFEDCVALAREHGLLSTEVAYLPMRAVTHMYGLRYQESLDDCRTVIDLTMKVGQARGELIARNTSSWILLDQCQFGPAEEDARKGLQAVEGVGARRFIPLFNDVIARICLQAGDRDGALVLLDESWKVSRDTGVSFAGPVVLGALALATTDPESRLEALRQGAAILGEGSASHNHSRFYRDAIEVCLREQLWDMVDQYATAMERYFGARSSPWSNFFIARGRALAAAGRGRRGRTEVERLRRLRDTARGHGILASLPSLEEPLPWGNSPQGR
jgi:tetratricopeptide (TPR) repeat protein